MNKNSHLARKRRHDKNAGNYFLHCWKATLLSCNPVKLSAFSEQPFHCNQPRKTKKPTLELCQRANSGTTQNLLFSYELILLR